MSTPVHRVSAAALLITLGIIFGDIGTSPLYVLKAVVGEAPISAEVVLGALSCIFWTLTLQTTVKYVVLTLQADNKGEGGIFSLYALVRRRERWLIIPAIIGGSALLADGIITPPISVSSAIEGLQILHPNLNTVPIVCAILVGLFSLQNLGTIKVGSTFGAIMLVWFLMLGILGASFVAAHPEVLSAINPVYGYTLLAEHAGGFWILGAVFLCTTGAEALYSDLGHCGRTNIRITWGFVKSALLLNYAGQSAWLIAQEGELLGTRNPFYEIMPEWFLLYGIVIATLATIIASQALISGSFTLVTEAVRLNLFPKLKVVYPTDLKGQIYVPMINWALLVGCIGIVLYFRESSNMEAAYGLAITVTMLMTTVLMGFYLMRTKAPRWAVFLFLISYFGIELGFLGANLLKFAHGGWVALATGFALSIFMWIWNKGHRLANRFTDYVNFRDYIPVISALSNDQSIPKYATHLVYLTPSESAWQVDTNIVDSIIRKRPKRADVYWLLHIDVVDEPHTRDFQVTTLIPEKAFRVDFFLGFRVEPKINLLFRKVIGDLSKNREVDVISRYESLRQSQISGDFRFVILQKFLSSENELSLYERFIMSGYYFLKKISLSTEANFGLDTSLVTSEKVPLVISPIEKFELRRVYD